MKIRDHHVLNAIRAILELPEDEDPFLLKSVDGKNVRCYSYNGSVQICFEEDDRVTVTLESGPLYSILKKIFL